MTAKTPVANYSPENVILLKSVYGSASTDEERKEAVTELANTVGKTVNSIRAKLSKMQIYIKPAKTNKAGTTPIRKAELVNKIADLTGKDAELMDSLEKATKFALEAVIAKIEASDAVIEELENDSI